jgi:hypothetical protein
VQERFEFGAAVGVGFGEENGTVLRHAASVQAPRLGRFVRERAKRDFNRAEGGPQLYPYGEIFRRRDTGVRFVPDRKTTAPFRRRLKVTLLHGQR